MQKLLALAVLLSLAGAARAQVSVEVVLDERQFLRGEPVTGRVKISNFSGQTVRLGGEDDWLTLTVTGEDSRALRALGAVPSVKPFQIESAKSVALRVDFEPLFDLQTAGAFAASARVRFAELQKEATSEPAKFDIIAGVKVWDKVVGVPGTTPPVTRRYALQQASFLKDMRLYARVTDANEASGLRVALLGVLPNTGRPVAEVDASSQLHVLFQAGQKTFTYSIITPDGELIVRQTHEITATRPRLRAEPDGRVVVAGGARKFTPNDLPPPPPRTDTNAVVQVK